jgi:ABC-2 type transport system permease protein
MPVVYGYLVPVLFLVGFAAVFRESRPPLVRELGQILTITILGGACFGMPTAMVSERERGVWRRYRLLPSSTATLVVSTMAARVVLIGGGCLLQILLAVGLYKMPWPGHPVQLIAAFLVVSWAFLGLGLIIANIAETVPAVQALGQAIFLPMILIGGIGVPLSALPKWAGVVAGFMPGKYAVQAMDACVFGEGLSHAGFSLVALGVIGAAAIAAAGNMFRWDAGQKLTGAGRIIAALAVWAGVGLAAMGTGQNSAIAPVDYESITAEQINSITYDDLQDDSSMVTPVVGTVDDLGPEIQAWTKGFDAWLKQWNGPADEFTRMSQLLEICAVADLGHFQYEGEVPYVVFRQLRDSIPPDELKKMLAFIVLHPPDEVATNASELGIEADAEAGDVRSRTVQYAKKLLGRVTGKLSW